jgi:hypothetical protein
MIPSIPHRALSKPSEGFLRNLHRDKSPEDKNPLMAMTAPKIANLANRVEMEEINHLPEAMWQEELGIPGVMGIAATPPVALRAIGT